MHWGIRKIWSDVCIMQKLVMLKDKNSLLLCFRQQTEQHPGSTCGINIATIGRRESNAMLGLAAMLNLNQHK